MDHKKLDKTIFKYLILGALALFAVLNFDFVAGALSQLWTILYPLLVGAALAYVFNVVMVKLERIWFPHSTKKWIIKTRRGICLVLTLLMIAALLTFLIVLILPELSKAIAVMTQSIPTYFAQLQDWLIANKDKIPSVLQSIGEMEINWSDTFDKLVSFATSGVGSLLDTTFTLVSTVALETVNIVMAIIFAVYAVASKEKLHLQFQKILKAFCKPRRVEQINRVFSVANQTFSSYIVGKCLDALALGVLCAVGMLIFRFPYTAMISSLVGVTALIPIVGAYIGAIVGAFMIFTVDPISAVWFLIFLIVLQQLEGNLIYPKLMSSSIGLPAMWVLAAVMVGGGVAGIAGMLLGVPVAATIYKLLGRKVNVKLKEQQKAVIQHEEQP